MRERILKRAIELFNERGVEYVGIREVARELGTKPGNITYYFPTKDDLVAAAGEELRALNDATLRIPADPSLAAYLGMLARAFRNHYRFRGLFLSMPNLMLRNEKLAAAYTSTTEKARRRLLKNYLKVLREEGFLRSDVSDAELDRVVSFLGLVTRGWIGDAAISFRSRSAAWCMNHYLDITADHLAAFATEKGLTDLRQAR